MHAPSRQETDLSIIQKYINGNTEEFGQIYNYYADPIYRFIYYKTHHREIAEDLTSQTFFKALDKISSYHPNKSSFRTWLYQIARNTVIDHYRTQHPTENIEDIFDLSETPDFATQTDNKAQVKELIQYLDQLKPLEREVVLLRIWEDLSYAEISQIIGKTESSLKMLFSRTIHKINQELTLAILLYFFIYI